MNSPLTPSSLRMVEKQSDTPSYRVRIGITSRPMKNIELYTFFLTGCLFPFFPLAVTRDEEDIIHFKSSYIWSDIWPEIRYPAIFILRCLAFCIECHCRKCLTTFVFLNSPYVSKKKVHSNYHMTSSIYLTLYFSFFLSLLSCPFFSLLKECLVFAQNFFLFEILLEGAGFFFFSRGIYWAFHFMSFFSLDE